MFGSESVVFCHFNYECDFQHEIEGIYDTLTQIRDLSDGICAACLKLD